MQELRIADVVSHDWLTENSDSDTGHLTDTAARTLRERAEHTIAKIASRYEFQSLELLPAGTTIGAIANPDLYRILQFTYLAEPHAA